MEQFFYKKEAIIAVTGLVGSAITAAFGGWNSALTTLVIVMAIDYITGIIVAAVFKRSKKTKSGTLSSQEGLKGLCKKGMMLLVVLVAVRLDMAVGTTFIKDCTVIAFIANEIISITENAGTMGVPIPKVITNAIDVLKSREENNV